MTVRYRNEPIYTAAIGAGRLMFGALRVKRDVRGAENFPDSGGAVIAITHYGFLEFALVEWVLWLHNRRRIRFMAKKGAFRGWPLGFWMRNMKHIPVDRDAGAGAYDAAIEALRRGELIGVFPEGTISRSFEVQNLKTGAARLAQEAGVPIVPVAVWGGHRILTKGAKGRRRDRFGVPVQVRVGAPITVAAGADVTTTTDALRGTLQHLTDELQASYPVDGTGQWWQPARLGGTAPTVAETAHEQRGSRRPDEISG
ncbi:1-acyl-sn-glycerol-3-phosphate acyltransferase [uncultured Schumannella sp.]|uniref:lysophospholipid acyltransferase family protein n=1 Tax=uncultured Schumannella sp. TaxID=1195956 RepID=UPI0025CF4A2D|nr:lysophospholipid acyltransferase family protein [uncultured Schumannella sp.]